MCNNMSRLRNVQHALIITKTQEPMYPMYKIIDIELDKWIYVASQVRPTLLSLHASSKGKHRNIHVLNRRVKDLLSTHYIILNLFDSI